MKNRILAKTCCDPDNTLETEKCKALIPVQLISNKTRITTLFLLWIIVHSLSIWINGIRLFGNSTLYIAGADYFLNNHAFQTSDQFFYAIPIIFISFPDFCLAIQYYDICC